MAPLYAFGPDGARPSTEGEPDAEGWRTADRIISVNGRGISGIADVAMDAALDVTNVTRAKQLFGTLHGDSNVVRWAHGHLSLGELVRTHHFKYWRNGDTMFHTNKGVVGLRIGTPTAFVVLR